MKTRFFVALCLVAVMALGGIQVVASYAPAAPGEPGQVDVALQQLLSDGQTSDLVVEFAEQADLTGGPNLGWQAQGERVVNALRAVAERAQGRAKAYLKARGVAHDTFLIGNQLYVQDANLQVAEHLASLPGVARVRAPITIYLDPIIDEAPVIQATTAWGIIDTKADQFWSTFGVQGDGIVVSNIDTGVQWNHPALVNQFKCPGDPSNPACWRDPSNICGGSACDNNGHGTHTMGTMVADDNPSLPYIAGMAPNAEWIACKGCESSSCSEYALNTCADWILAPGGSSANRPHLVNNSWGGGGGNTWYLGKVQAWRAAGVFPAFSAGNNYSCSSLGSPGDYQESFGSAAHASSRVIASFSSKGPSTFGHEPYTKPNISAPGVSVCSTIPTNSWSCGYSGTSMASPHTAGAVALLWSCNSSLIGQIDQTFQILQDNADTPPAGSCGAPPDGEGNYTYGYGYLNVLAAGNIWCGGAPTPTPTFTPTSPPPTPTFTPTPTSPPPTPTFTRTPTPTPPPPTPTFTPTPTSTPPPFDKTVLWDTYHGVFLGYSPSNYYSNLVADLTSWGYFVDENNSGVLNLDLSQYDAIVVNLGSNWYSAYSAAEAAAIRDFVEGGGGLIVMGDNRNCPNANINPVAQLFGTTTGGPNYLSSITDLDPHYIFNGITSLYFAAGGDLTATAPSYTVGRDGSGRLAVNVARYGRGKVVALGDINLWAQYYTYSDDKDVTRGDSKVDSGFIMADNQPFARNVFGWVTSPTVLWDTYHGILLGYSPSNYYSNLKAALEGRGYILDENNAGVLNRDLAAYEGIVVNLGSAWNSAYSAAEADAIEEFVADGGGLIIMGDNTGCPNGNINPVAQRFGTTAGVGSISSTLSDLEAHLIFDNVSSIYFAAGGALSATAPSRVVARDSSARAGVNVVNYGAGKVVVTGDVNVWAQYLNALVKQDATNRDAKEAAAGIQTADNMAFAMNTFDWITSLRGTILWDTYHGVFLGYSPSNYYSALVADLESWGYTVDENNSGVLNVNLFRYAAIVVNLGSSWNSAYSAAEADAIEDFVEDGGGLIFMGDNSYCPNGNINPVGQRFGTTAGGYSYIYNITNLLAHHIFNEVTSLYFGSGGALSTSAPSQTVGRDSGGYAAVNVARAGRGRMLGLGDVNLWAQYYTYSEKKDVTRGEGAVEGGFIMADNTPFARHAFDWATFRSTAP